jgi:hypothetical protein
MGKRGAPVIGWLRALQNTEVPNHLSDDMKPRDVIWVLRHLPFERRRNQMVAVEIDRGIRDYLIDRIQSRRDLAASAFLRLVLWHAFPMLIRVPRLTG